MPRIYDGYDEDDGGGRVGGDDACAECALPCLFLLGPAAVFLVLGIGMLHSWRHASGSTTREAALVELRSAVDRWEKHRPLLEGLRITANLSVPGLPPQQVELRLTRTQTQTRARTRARTRTQTRARARPEPEPEPYAGLAAAAGRAPADERGRERAALRGGRAIT